VNLLSDLAYILDGARTNRLIPFGNMPAKRKPVRVLVVDDDAMSRELLGVLLEGQGYQVESADSGDAALALLSGSHAPPQIVLTDIQMPGISGTRLADGLRKACGPATLLLAMSGSGPDKEAISHFDGFLLKPFTMEQMRSTVAARRKAKANLARIISAPVAASTPTRASKFRMEGQKLQSPGPEIIYETENASPTLDERIYGQLKEAMPGQQLQQMYTMCVNDARDRIAAMRGLVTQRDGAQFIREAHAIKGGCGMLGATEIYGMAAHLETSGLGAVGLEGAPGVNPLDELIAACDRLERILGSRV
jgi:CheY-like chemotaxis protein